MSQILDAIKLTAGVAIGIVLASVYYNGVPVLKGIPYIGAAFEGQAKKELVPEFQALALKAVLDQLKSIRRRQNDNCLPIRMIAAKEKIMHR